jgi:EAL domain-containing protein (putative c-di-GMP-specific phosphodiesterase class I)
VIDLADKRTCGLEALIRWQKPGAGLVMPDDFIPAIENGDLILDVDRWVLHEAAAQLVRWSHDPAMSDVDMWVNISGRHLANRRVVEDVQSALDQSGLPASRLGIEITETAPIDTPHAVEHMRQLSALGVRIALDDFGTGHTSISQLLDRSLISGPHASTTQGSRPIGQLVIEMARSLGLVVVAEGIEGEDQVTALLSGRCDRGQGYYFSPPVEAADVPVPSTPVQR